MCLIDMCEEMMRLAAAMETERARPDVPCRYCTDDVKCPWHRTYFQQTEQVTL